MRKIIYLPLDERPCNYDFPSEIFNQEPINIVTVPKELLGYKKTRGNLELVNKWLLSESKDAYGLVISIDTLVYGGIVPSRLHFDLKEQLIERLHIVKKIKDNNPNLKIFAFSLIMRCPTYNSDDEEPDYYANYGVAIHKTGINVHYEKIGKTVEHIYEVPEDYLTDYVERREKNTVVNLSLLDLVSDKIIDFLVIPQDDSSEYGYTALDQEVIRKKIVELKLLNNVYMYPGADEVGMTLMSRMYLNVIGKRPKVYLKYPSITSANIIPNIEDRPLDITVKYQIIVSGGIVVTSLVECDAVVYINAPADRMLSRLMPKEEGAGFTTLRNMVEVMEFLEYAHKQLNKQIIIGDITYGNGSSLEMYNFLVQKDMLLTIGGYGGWNTASNSIGGAIAQGFMNTVNTHTEKSLSFLIKRYIEDIAYCGYVRQTFKLKVGQIIEGANYYDVKNYRNEITKALKLELLEFVDNNMNELNGTFEITDLYMPWKRLYEIGLSIKYLKK